MDAKDLEIKLKNIEINFLEEIIYKLFMEEYNKIKEVEANKILEIIKRQRRVEKWKKID